MGIIEWIVLGLLLSLLVRGPLNPARRRNQAVRYAGEAPPATAERTYPDHARSAAAERAYPEQATR